MKFQIEKRKGGRQAKASELILPQEEFERFDILHELNIPKEKILLWKTSLEQGGPSDKQLGEFTTLFPGESVELNHPPKPIQLRIGPSGLVDEVMWNRWVTHQATQVEKKYVKDTLWLSETLWEFRAAAKLLCPEILTIESHPEARTLDKVIQAFFARDLLDYGIYSGLGARTPPFAEKLKLSRRTIIPDRLVSDAAWIRLGFPELYPEIEKAFPQFKAFVQGFVKWWSLTQSERYGSNERAAIKCELDLIFAAAVLLADEAHFTLKGVELLKHKSILPTQALPERPTT